MTVRQSQVNFKEHAPAYTNNYRNSAYAQHLIKHGHSLGRPQDVMDIIFTTHIGRHLDTFKRLHIYIYNFLWRCGPTWAMAYSFLRVLNHTQRRITVGRTPLDKWSACSSDLYMTTHNNHNRQAPKPTVGFEPTP